jgi:hypothetical protein
VFLSIFSTDRTTATMGVSWQTPDQKAFIEEHLPSYIQHSTDGTLKTMFWSGFLEKWFETWPLPEPSAELSEKEGSVQKATKAVRDKKVGVRVDSLPMN